jgi:hypothetical protein
VRPSAKGGADDAPRLIITLSSIPPRFHDLGPTLQSLLDQKAPADEIILYIPEKYRRFPRWNGQLPGVPPGVSIRRVASDYGPATKVLPAIEAFSGQNVDILFCDDDRAYDPEWTARFRNLRERMPGVCIAEGGKDLSDIEDSARSPVSFPRIGIRKKDWKDRIKSALRVKDRHSSRFISSGYCDVFLGTWGVLVRPEFFTAAVFNIPDVLWTVDDYWLAGHLTTNRIAIWVNADAPFVTQRKIAGVSSLRRMVYAGHDRHAANDACVRYYRENFGIWLPKGRLPASTLSSAIGDLAER